MAQLVIYLDSKEDSGQLQAPGSFTTEKSGSDMHWIIAWEGLRVGLGVLEKCWSSFSCRKSKKIFFDFLVTDDYAVAADTVDEESNY